MNKTRETEDELMEKRLKEGGFGSHKVESSI